MHCVRRENALCVQHAIVCSVCVCCIERHHKINGMNLLILISFGQKVIIRRYCASSDCLVLFELLTKQWPVNLCVCVYFSMDETIHSVYFTFSGTFFVFVYFIRWTTMDATMNMVGLREQLQYMQLKPLDDNIELLIPHLLQSNALKFKHEGFVRASKYVTTKHEIYRLLCLHSKIQSAKKWRKMRLMPFLPHTNASVEFRTIKEHTTYL